MIRIAKYAESISRLRNACRDWIGRLLSVDLYKMVPFLYNLTDIHNEKCGAAVYSAFSNIYIYILLAAERCISSVKPEVQEMWDYAELLRKKLLSVRNEHWCEG